MPARLSLVVVLACILAGPAWTAEKEKPAANAPVFAIAPAGGEAGPAKFTEAQRAFVQSWIRQKAPECPAEKSAAVADDFLDELQQRYPEKLNQLLKPGFPSAGLEPMLLRQIAANLTGASQTPLREELARRRVGAVLATGGRDAPAALADAAGLIAKIKEASPAQYRRLVDGKMDEDDLELQIKKAREPAVAKVAAPAKPKILTAADIVAEFSRRNQAGAALQRLHAYAVEGRLTNAAGEEQELLLFKMRPDRFRLVVRAGGFTRYLMGADGTRFWQQSPGQPPQIIPPDKMGARRYLSEFADPLLLAEGFTFERRDDGEREGKKFYRISVRRPDGSGYVAGIDMESYREIFRENEDKSVAHYSDFREVGGLTYAFREEVVEPGGRKGSFVVTRISPNPGLIQDLFNLPDPRSTNYFQIEQMMTPTAAAVVKSSR